MKGDGQRAKLQQKFIKMWVDRRLREHEFTEREVWWLVAENTGRRWTRQESIWERVKKARARARGDSL